MSGPTLYDDDILLWSEQQAAAIRKLGTMARNLPNELDIENVAEEIESVGRSELAAVKSYIRLIFLHLMKLCRRSRFTGSGALAQRDCRLSFRHDRRYAPSMRQRIDLDEIWRSARERSTLTYDGAQQQAVSLSPVDCPFSLDDFIAERIDVSPCSSACSPRARSGG